MSFGENVGFYRKKLGLTQEELAERLFVSRQTVSRWETDSTFPDVEMLIRLCDLFECSMDTLVRGTADGASKKAENPEGGVQQNPFLAYDGHMNKFALQIALGVFGIIFGVAVLLLTQAFSVAEEISVTVLLLFIGGAVAVFIISGIGHEDFMKRNPNIAPYPKEIMQKYSKKMAAMMTVATVLIFGGVIAIVITCGGSLAIPDGFTTSEWECLGASILLFAISVSVFLYVLAGILHSKYEIDSYNSECIEEGYAKGVPYQKKKPSGVSDAVCGVIMLSATAGFLILGFVGNLWHPGWVVFPVGGILCGVVSVIADAISKK